jgi:hypothetical protein
MKPLILTAILAIASIPASAAMPPDTYAGPIQDRIVAQARCTFSNLDAGHVVLPQFLGLGGLRAGQYVNPTTCKVEGAPTGPQF